MKTLAILIIALSSALAHAQTPIIGGGGTGTAIVGPPSNQVGSDQALAQTANVSSRLLYAVPAGKAGWYVVAIYTVVTVAAQTSGTLPNGIIAWTDGDTVSANGSLGQTSTTNLVGATNVSGNIQNVKYIHVAANSNINWSTASYASSGSPSLAYNAYAKLYYVGP